MIESSDLCFITAETMTVANDIDTVYVQLTNTLMQCGETTLPKSKFKSCLKPYRVIVIA